MGMATIEAKAEHAVPGSPWIDMRDNHPPVNGTPVIVCFEKEVSKSFVHVGVYNTNSHGKPMLVANGMFGFDLPQVLYWQQISLPWHMGHSEPRIPTSSAM